MKATGINRSSDCSHLDHQRSCFSFCCLIIEPRADKDRESCLCQPKCQIGSVGLVKSKSIVQEENKKMEKVEEEIKLLKQKIKQLEEKEPHDNGSVIKIQQTVFNNGDYDSGEEENFNGSESPTEVNDLKMQENSSLVTEEFKFDPYNALPPFNRLDMIKEFTFDDLKVQENTSLDNAPPPFNRLVSIEEFTFEIYNFTR